MTLTPPMLRSIALLSLVFAPATRADELLGPGGVRFRTGDVRDLVVSDVDRDGLLDLVVTTVDAGGTLRVLVGDGAGGFLVGEQIPVTPDELGPANPMGIVATDLDRDGDDDLVVANQALGSASVLIGNGEGGFRFHSTHDVLAAPVDLAASDFNEDGHPDVAVANQGADRVSILLGVGDGRFTDAGSQPVGSGPLALAVADFDGDGHFDLAVLHFLDIVAGDEDRDISILLGDGEGGFTRLPDVDLERNGEDLRQPRDLVARDFDGDGQVDLAVAVDFNGIVQILFGNGDGSFAAAQTIDVDRQPVSLAATDLDDDGDLDLIVARRFASAISILLNDGTGTFSRSCVRAESPGQCVETTLAFPDKVVAADFDADGAPDLAAVNRPGGTVSLLLGDGLGSVGRNVVLGAGSAPQGVAVADIDGDENDDVVIANTAEDTLTIRFGDGARGFGRATTVSQDVGAEPVAVIARDFDRDGLSDLAVANFAGESVSVLLGNGTGSFPRSQVVPVWIGPIALAAADFDEDGFADLAVVNSSQQVFPGNVLSIRFGGGDGTFRCVPQSCTDDLRLPDGAGAISVGDLDSDGHVDLAVTNQVTDIVRIFLGDGAGAFSRVNPDLTVEEGPAAVAIGRFDRDELPDLAVAHADADAVRIFRGRGGGSFEPLGASIPAGTRPSAMVARDVNADGVTDLLVVSEGSNSMSLLLGDGEGQLQPMPDVSVGVSPRALATGDFDHDGRIDAVVAQRLEDSAAILFNHLALRADANGSNRVDGFDVAALGIHASAARPEADYRRNLDVDLDGRISGDDLAIMGERFGELSVSASPLRGTLQNASPPGPKQVAFAAGEIVGDRLTVRVVFHDTGSNVAAASFAVTFGPDAVDGDQSPVLEYLGSRPGDYFKSAAGQLVSRGDDREPGRVQLTVVRLPLGAAAGKLGVRTIIELVFRALRRGRIDLGFDGFSESTPALLDSGFAPIPEISFVGGSRVTVDDTGGGEPWRKIGTHPESLEFADTVAGGASRRVLRVSNFGFAPLEIHAVSICPVGGSPPCPAEVLFGTFLSPPTTVPPFGFVELTVEFEPRTVGSFQAELVLDSDDPDRPRTAVPLSGRSVAATRGPH